MVVSLSMLFDW